MRVEYVDPPGRGRLYSMARRVHLGDVDHTAKLRLEALARFLQDVATDDAHDAGLSGGRGVWVLRRVDMEIAGLPALYDPVELHTFCSGTGPRWAERRTRMTGSGRVLVEAVAVWVYIDGARGRSLPLGDEFAAVYAESTCGRRVSGRLHHRAPSDAASTRPWLLRASDYDVLDHVNNARSLEAVEDELAARLPTDRPVRASAEYRGTIEQGEQLELASEVVDGADGGRELLAWLVSDGEVRVSASVTTADGSAEGRDSWDTFT